jgi:diphthamide biosynthesis protein 7
MPAIERLRSLVLDLPPSCIEFWPSNPQYAVVGTYNLEKGADQEKDDAPAESEETLAKRSQQRNGSLILFQVVGNDV